MNTRVDPVLRSPILPLASSEGEKSNAELLYSRDRFAHSHRSWPNHLLPVSSSTSVRAANVGTIKRKPERSEPEGFQWYICNMYKYTACDMLR